MRTWILHVALAVALAATSAVAGESKFKVIVHPDNPTVSVERRFLSNAFLKKTTRWADGETILPVDLPAGSPVREKFADEVLERSINAVKSYWQQALFSGRDIPPPEVSSDEAVVHYVLGRRGGVGYVSPGADIRGAKVVTVR